MGPDTYDLASLLRDSYVDLERTSRSNELIAEFRQRKGGPASRARPTSARRFDLMALQRNLKALGTFGYRRRCGRTRVYLPVHPAHAAPARARNLHRATRSCRGLHRAAGAPPRGAASDGRRVRIEDFGDHVGEDVTRQGLAAQQALAAASCSS